MIEKKIKKTRHIVLLTIISQIIMHSFCKIELNSEELELLEYALVITFFLQKIVSEDSLTSFNFSCGSC